MKKWGEKEVEILRKNVNEDCSMLIELLPKRSLKAIIGKKDRLKLKRKSKFYWSKKEDNYIIQNYHEKPIQEISKKLKKSYGAIHNRRIRLIKQGFNIKDKKEFLSNYWREQYRTNKVLKSKHNKAIKKLWDNGSFRKKHKISIQKKFKNLEFFEKHKRSFLERRNSEEFRKKQSKVASETMYRRHKDPVQHKKILKNLRKNPSNQQLYALHYLRNKLKEKINCNDWDILDFLMEIDIAIPKLKIAIEWDGEYWHSKIPNVEDRDRKKNGLIIGKGWKFIRVNDSQLSKKEIEERCENILEIIKEQNDNKYGYTGGFYI